MQGRQQEHHRQQHQQRDKVGQPHGLHAHGGLEQDFNFVSYPIKGIRIRRYLHQFFCHLSHAAQAGGVALGAGPMLQNSHRSYLRCHFYYLTLMRYGFFHGLYCFNQHQQAPTRSGAMTPSGT